MYGVKVFLMGNFLEVYFIWRSRKAKNYVSKPSLSKILKDEVRDRPPSCS